LKLITTSSTVPHKQPATNHRHWWHMTPVKFFGTVRTKQARSTCASVLRSPQHHQYWMTNRVHTSSTAVCELLSEQHGFRYVSESCCVVFDRCRHSSCYSCGLTTAAAWESSNTNPSSTRHRSLLDTSFSEVLSRQQQVSTVSARLCPGAAAVAPAAAEQSTAVRRLQVLKSATITRNRIS
jgi:hypothetical protein